MILRRKCATIIVMNKYERARHDLRAYLENPRKCENCDNLIMPPPSDPTFSRIKDQRFCSRRCAAAVNNKLKPKRLAAVRSCKGCGDPITHSITRRWYCPSCADVRAAALSRATKLMAGRRPIAAHARKRTRNRPQQCAVCGYDKHVECAHLTPVSSFPITATLDEINRLENLVLLCPNHHWEFDSGMLVLAEGIEPSIVPL